MERGREQAGSALVLALLVAFVMSLLGVSFLLMAQTESRIAVNERVAAQTLYVAEAGAHVVQSWFDRPDDAFGFPTAGVVVRSRGILVETDPYGVGTVVGPEYKEGVDLDSDSVDDLFRQPFRGTPEDTLLGKEDAPDMRIVDAGFLQQLTDDLLGDFASSNSTLRPRIERIDVYAPPYVEMGSNWVRHGVATIKVVAGMYRTGPLDTGRKLAEKSVVTVLNEVPYSTPVYGPVHVCGDLELDGKLRAHWGAVTATGQVIYDEVSDIDMLSLPRGLPPGPRLDRLWTNDPAWIDEFNANAPAVPVPSDPWLRLISRGQMAGPAFDCTSPVENASVPGEQVATMSSDRPCPPSVPAIGAVVGGDLDEWPWKSCDHSGVLQNQILVGCPEYDYRYWKRLATSGVSGVRYFVWSTGDRFTENGVGPELSFSQIFADAAGEPTLWFFDTEDRRPPTDDNGDGTLDNLTPEITVTGGWNARGFIYLNSERLRSSRLDDPPPLPVVYQAPGEPILETGDAWINLVYPTNVDDRFTFGGPADWDPRGPAFNATASLHGILFNSGEFWASEGGTYYGSVIARSGAYLDGTTTPISSYYWDPSIPDFWPQAGWNLPRVFATRMDVVP